MPASPPANVGEVVRDGSLRTAHKDLTRERIRVAAKTLFYSASVAATTIDQIVAAAGVSRPTFYAHFRDKDAVVKEIVEAYATRSLAVNRRLPGPTPDLDQIRAWLDEKVAFYREEHVSLALLYQAGHRDPGAAPPVVRSLMHDVLAVYAERLPAFQTALEPGPHQPHAGVRAETLIRQITWACEFCAREGPTPRHKAALDITAESFLSLLEYFSRLTQ